MGLKDLGARLHSQDTRGSLSTCMTSLGTLGHKASGGSYYCGLNFIYIYIGLFVFFSVVVVVVAISWAAPTAYGSSQARG